MFYRNYIKSSLWEERKRRYFERHARVCYICGSVDRVELNHIKYGNYGAEKDFDLVALCREHHQALHDLLGVRGNMHRQTEYFLRDEIAKYNAEHETPLQQRQVADQSNFLQKCLQLIGWG